MPKLAHNSRGDRFLLERTRFFVRLKKKPALYYGAQSLAAGFLIWEIGARILNNSFFLAPPSAVFLDLIDLFLGPVYPHLWISSVEFLLGLSLGTVCGVGLGVMMALSAKGRHLIDPWVNLLNSMPSVALAPLFILWFGIGIWSKVAVVFLAAVIPILVNTTSGILSADLRLVEAARAFGASSWQEAWIVRLPWALPSVVSGLRLAVGRGLVGIVVGELFGARAGIGFLIYDATNRFDSAGLLAAVAILSIAGIASTYGLDVLQKRLGGWKGAS
jgi:NitT/TauT family transport system permease protein